MRSITSTLREDQYKFLIIYRSIILTMRSVSDKTIETHCRNKCEQQS